MNESSPQMTKEAIDAAMRDASIVTPATDVNPIGSAPVRTDGKIGLKVRPDETDDERTMREAEMAA